MYIAVDKPYIGRKNVIEIMVDVVPKIGKRVVLSLSVS